MSRLKYEINSLTDVNHFTLKHEISVSDAVSAVFPNVKAE